MLAEPPGKSVYSTVDTGHFADFQNIVKESMLHAAFRSQPCKGYPRGAVYPAGPEEMKEGLA